MFCPPHPLSTHSLTSSFSFLETLRACVAVVVFCGLSREVGRMVLNRNPTNYFAEVRFLTRDFDRTKTKRTAPSKAPARSVRAQQSGGRIMPRPCDDIVIRLFALRFEHELVSRLSYAVTCAAGYVAIVCRRSPPLPSSPPWSVKTRRRAPSRHCRDATVYIGMVKRRRPCMLPSKPILYTVVLTH